MGRQHEVRYSWDDPRAKDPEKVTELNQEEFWKKDLDLNRDECDLIDDPDSRERIIKMNTRKSFHFT